MRTWRVVPATLTVLLLVGVLGLFGCSGDDETGGSAGAVLLDTTVAVAGNGGSATVFFQGVSGQTVRIALTGPATTEPYGFLEPPGGTATYTPPNSGRQGSNEADANLTVTGQFSLTIFDGTNRGGSVRVVVTVVS